MPDVLTRWQKAPSIRARSAQPLLSETVKTPVLNQAKRLFWNSVFRPVITLYYRCESQRSFRRAQGAYLECTGNRA